MRYGSPINADVVVVVEPEEFLPRELCAVVDYDGVWDPKSVDDVREEQHGLLGFDHGDRLSFYPLSKHVYGDKQVSVAPGHLFELSNLIESLDCERPGDGDRLECMG